MTGGDFSYDATTWNLGATYRITPETEAYGGFSQGFALPDVGTFTRRAGLSLAYACTVACPNCLPAGTSEHRGQEVRGNLVGFVSTSDKGVTFDSVTNTLSQQKEIIYGVEPTAEWDPSRAFTLGGPLSWREGQYGSDRDGDIDSYLPNNRIPTPLRSALSGT